MIRRQVLLASRISRSTSGFAVGTEALEVVPPRLYEPDTATVPIEESIMKHIDICSFSVWNHSDGEVRVKPVRTVLVTHAGHLDSVKIDAIDQEGHLGRAESED